MTTPNENEKNMCSNPQLVEVERKEEKMTEAIQTNNTITKHYKTGFCQPASLQTTFVRHE
jgi:hypothetical protein